MLNIDIVIAGFIISLIALAMKSMQSMRSELKDSLKHETDQNEKISSNNHRIELLEKDVEHLEDKLTLSTNGLSEKINHMKNRVEERLRNLENKQNER